MATPNPFAQFISGLFGNISSTSGAKTSTPATSSSYAGPYSSSYYGGASPVSAASASASKPAAARDPRIGANASYVNPANATASKGTVPYIPAGPNGGGMSVVPTQTSVATGKPSAPGTQTPSNISAYTGYLQSQASPATSSYSASSSRSPSSVGSSSVSTGTTTAAPPAAPTSSTGVYSSAPGGYTGGTSGPTGGATDYRKAYTDMLASLYDPDELKSSQTSLKKIRERAAEAQLGERHEEARIRENDVGQGLKSFNGQLTENSRKSSAELADLAIAANPFEQYINSAMGAAKDIYGVGRDETADARNDRNDALTAAKFEEDKRQYGLDYALKVQTENRVASAARNAALKPSAQETIAAYTNAFTPGTAEYKQAQSNLGGIPPVDAQGYITPEGFKAAAAEAAASGITRKQFIEMFGSQLYADPKTGNPSDRYGLTAVEKKLIAGTPAD